MYYETKNNTIDCLTIAKSEAKEIRAIAETKTPSIVVSLLASLTKTKPVSECSFMDEDTLIGWDCIDLSTLYGYIKEMDEKAGRIEAMLDNIENTILNEI